jgi:hypothetical protein
LETFQQPFVQREVANALFSGCGFDWPGQGALEELHRRAAVLEAVDGERERSGNRHFLFRSHLLAAEQLRQGKRLLEIEASSTKDAAAPAPLGQQLQ